MAIVFAAFHLSVALLQSNFVTLVIGTNSLKEWKDLYQVQDITVSRVLFALQAVLSYPGIHQRLSQSTTGQKKLPSDNL